MTKKIDLAFKPLVTKKKKKKPLVTNVKVTSLKLSSKLQILDV